MKEPRGMASACQARPSGEKAKWKKAAVPIKKKKKKKIKWEPHLDGM